MVGGCITRRVETIVAWVVGWVWIDLQSSGSLEVGEHLDDMGGHRWRSGQMISGGDKAVLIRGPIDGEDGAIGRGVRVRSA